MIERNSEWARFRVCGTWLGVPVAQVESIGRLTALTPQWMLPAHFRGFTVAQGETFVVFDVAGFLGMTDPFDGGRAVEKGRLVVVRAEDMSAAIMVSDTGKLMSLDAQEISSPEVIINGRLQSFLTGVVESDLGRVGLLDVAKLLGAARG